MLLPKSLARLVLLAAMYPLVSRADAPVPCTLEPPSLAAPRRDSTSPPVSAVQVTAVRYRAPVYGSAAVSGIVGYVRRGTKLWGTATVGHGCGGGSWYALVSRGFVCTRRGFAVATSDGPLGYRAPAVSRPLPYDYVKVTNDRALRLRRLPGAAELQQLKQGRWPGRLVDRRMKGVFFLAVDRLLQRATGAYYRTTRGRFAARSDVEPVTPTRLRGELLDRDELPLAFVFGEDRPLYRLEGDRLQRCGTARRYARFAVERILEHDSGELVEGPDELVLRRDAVRLATPQGPPAGVAPDERWIHVDLPEQVIVAYEGSRPVFASLVSTGRRGHTTPTGLYRIRSKHVSATMRGEDDDKGWYEVEEVPWTMYYRRLYAIHGAYWHDGFGEVRSHGCTNLAPADARWLFHWTSPKVPAGWHGLYGRGTRVLFTN